MLAWTNFAKKVYRRHFSVCDMIFFSRLTKITFFNAELGNLRNFTENYIFEFII